MNQNHVAYHLGRVMPSCANDGSPLSTNDFLDT